MSVTRKKRNPRPAKVASKKSRARPRPTEPKPGAASSIDLRDTIVSDKLIELPAGRSFIGPNVELRGCRIVLPRDAKLTIGATTLVRCTLVANLRSDAIWDRVFWKDCRFEGVFHKTGLGPYKPGEGDVDGCDFRDASLHSFELRNCVPETCQFAPWPTYVVLHPRKNKEAIRALKWPGWMTFIMTGMASLPESKVAIVDNAQLMLKELAKNGTTLTLKQLHDSLARLGPAVILDGGPASHKVQKRSSSLN